MMTEDWASGTHVLVLTDSPETAQLVPRLLGEIGGLVVSTGPAAGADAVATMEHHRPQVVVIVDTLEPLPAVVATLDAASPEVPQVVILPEGDVACAVACSLAGARATLLKPFERQRLLEAIQIVHARGLRIQQQQLVSSETVGTADVRQQRPRLIAVHGANGGVGATTIACNLASALLSLTHRRVALIDGDLLRGDVGVLCGLSPTRTMVELLPEIQQLDAEIVEHTFAHHRSGVDVLLAPEQLQQADAIKGDEVKRALNTLRPYFDYQIVDTASSLVSVSLAVMSEADLIVLVVTPGLAALRNAARFLRLAGQLNFPKEKILLVANRADTGHQINVRVIEEQLHRSVAVAIPFDGKVPVECMNAGELLVQAFPRSRVAQSTNKLAREVARCFGWESLDEARHPPHLVVAPKSGGTGSGTAAPPEAPRPAWAAIVNHLTRRLTATKREPSGNL